MFRDDEYLNKLSVLGSDYKNTIRSPKLHCPMSGVVAEAFVSADADADDHLSTSEAVSSAHVIESYLIKRRCIMYSSSLTCFGRFCGSDLKLNANEYTSAFIPCLLSGLSDLCRSICAEVI